MFPQVTEVGVAHDVCDEAQIAWPQFAGEHDDVVHRRVAREHRLDLAQLDPEAADLDLVVGAAEELQVALRAPARQVTGAVQASLRPGHEALGGQGRTVQVGVRELDSREVQLAGNTGGHRAQEAVEHVHPRVPDGPPDRHDRVLTIGPALPVRDVDRGLGRAVQVVQTGGQQLGEPAAGRVGQRLTTADHPTQSGAPSGRRLRQELLQHRRHEVDGGDPFALDQPGQVGRVTVPVRLGHDQRRAGDERPEELPDGHVEPGGRLLQHPVVGGEPVLVLHPQQPVDDARVRDHRTLGFAGRTGRVDHVRRMRRQQSGVERGGVLGREVELTEEVLGEHQ
ncbi:hypothetical protein GCM10010185_54900 [Saccharothrix coeruleofusca]|uniref:Uncharacterized protein n=1 Tax=Saccharothrix coeruleofusca TaxID=33919 RepID=A0A918AQS9_9PSEU|nr:hypothetical protein GCM10010185_54900 [Saccharothrix coeruleofusca]